MYIEKKIVNNLPTNNKKYVQNKFNYLFVGKKYLRFIYKLQASAYTPTLNNCKTKLTYSL